MCVTLSSDGDVQTEALKLSMTTDKPHLLYFVHFLAGALGPDKEARSIA